MARWKLTEPHYLNCPDSEWEHTTNDVRTGRPVRKKFRVPKHLDPRIEDDWNYRLPQNSMDGEIHVCWAGKGLSHDIVFEGNPTPGMVPLDEEATAISAKFDWTPTPGVDEESQRASFYSKLTDKLINQLSDMRADATIAASTSAPQIHGLEHLMKAISDMMAQNQQLIALLAGKAAPSFEDELEKQAKALGETKPVFDEVEPLDEVAPTEAEIAEAARIAAEKEEAAKAKSFNRLSSRRI